MKATKRQLIDALLLYVDQEYCAKVSGFSKWLVPMFIGSYSPQFEKMIDDNQDLLTSMGILCPDGYIDVDKLYSMIMPIAQKQGKVTQNFKLLGDISFSFEDIDRLYQKLKIICGNM